MEYICGVHIWCTLMSNIEQCSITHKLFILVKLKNFIYEKFA